MSTIELTDQPVGEVLRTPLDELPVDLHEVERQVLQVVERPEAGAEVVECEPAAQPPEPVRELARRLDVGDGGGLGELEDELRRVDVVRRHQVDEVVREVGVADRVRGQVDLDVEARVDPLQLLSSTLPPRRPNGPAA